MARVSRKTQKARERGVKMAEAKKKKKSVVVATASAVPVEATPSPSTSGTQKRTYCSASKRKRLLYFREDSESVEQQSESVEKQSERDEKIPQKEDKSVLIKLSELASIADKSCCKQCGGDVSFLSKPMVWGSGCAGVAVPSVTSMRTFKGRMMSIPIRHGGDSSPTITMKLTLPLASPHWMSRCSVLPAICRGLPCAPWTVFSKGLSARHWAR